MVTIETLIIVLLYLRSQYTQMIALGPGDSPAPPSLSYQGLVFIVLMNQFLYFSS